MGNTISAVVGAAAGIASTAIANVESSATLTFLDKYLSQLSGNGITSKLYTAAHAALGLETQASSVLMAPLVAPKGQQFQKFTQWSSIISIGEKAAEVMNGMWELFRQPNIEGITIFTEKETTDREADISTNPLIVQDNTPLGTTTQTRYATDNIVTKPRTWQLNGHLTTVLPMDSYFVVKPSLLMQRDYLDNCMQTRKPVVFKAFDNTFHRVLIQRMHTEWDSKSMNTMSISISLVEYVPISVDSTIPNIAVAALQQLGVEVLA